jgi:IS30 family transposase
MELRWCVAQKLAPQWSPEQISGWLKQEFPTHQDMRISHEAIYRSLFIQTRGVLLCMFIRSSGIAEAATTSASPGKGRMDNLWKAHS